MKRILQLLLAGLGLLLASGSAGAQSYSIDWRKVAGGGGTGTNAQYRLSGTLGQHDAGGPATGGNSSVSGGFWSLVALQGSGAPRLSLFHTSTNAIVVSWPSPSAGYELQQSGDLTTPNWVAPPETVADDGTNRFIVVVLPAPARYFRLVHP